LHGTRELDLANLVTANDVDVVALSEAEVPASEAQFTLDGFTTFCPLVKPGEKTREMLLVKTDVAVKTKARLANKYLSDRFPSVWVQLDSHAMRNGDHTSLCGAVLLCAVYHRWGSLTSEKSKLDILKEQFLRASASRKAIVLTGDLNLEVTRRQDSGYRCKAMLVDLQDAAAAAGFEYHITSHTFRSYGMHSDGGAPHAHRYSTIDHTYTPGVVASVKVLTNLSSDHRPLVTVVNASVVRDPEGLSTIQRQNFKRLKRLVLEAALLQYNCAAIYQLRDVNVALKYLKAGIMAPLTMVKVRKGKRDTLELMTLRDPVAKGCRYRKLRNRCSVLVERDKRNSNQSKLTKSKDDPRVLSELANNTLGKQGTSLPQSVNNVDGSMTEDRVATAEAMNSFYICKIELLRRPLVNCPLEKNALPTKTAPFEFKYCNAKKVAKIIKGLSNTTAVGTNGIPVIVLKLATDVLAGPISHFNGLQNGNRETHS
jgi:hypothetical protein